MTRPARGPLDGAARGLLAVVGQAAREEIVWLLRWTIRLAVLGVVLLAAVRWWLIPAGQRFLAEQRAAVVTQLRDAATPHLDIDLESLRDQFTGGGTR